MSSNCKVSTVQYISNDPKPAPNLVNKERESYFTGLIRDISN